MTDTPAYEECWCCGQSRWSGPNGWCPTCRAPAQPQPGVQYQTFRGPLLVPVTVPTKPASAKAQPHRGRWLIAAAAAAVAVAGLVAVGGLSGSQGSGGRAVPAAACLQVVGATREYAAGTRSSESLLSTVRSAEGMVRNAQVSDPALTPELTAVVNMRTRLEAGLPPDPPDVAVLLGECG